MPPRAGFAGATARSCSPRWDQSRIGLGPFLRIGRLYRVEGKVPDATLTLGDLHHPAPQFSFGLSNSPNNLYRDLPSGDIISQIHAVRIIVQVVMVGVTQSKEVPRHMNKIRDRGDLFPEGVRPL